ncbi:hypothetical protein SAMN05192575_105246 [Nocardioides alpinus]|uniref:Uncharacterized protein n=1 Tax=Nocardioides alpinus TaxID=748909 RepID=A0A1I0ZGC4_9ACTN|nr:hypothetical protein [Nocardioides alpinus]PKH40667.1 hypothetical protein CXG46_11790 [Nocardioides alpinus]SFB23590.1 hypothetical protein SAMN05192575_105246 [Nocardioides alpinus]
MTIAATEPQASYDEWRTRRWRLTSLTFGLLWLVTAVAVVLVGEKQSDLSSLAGSLANGSVTRVEVVGLPQDPDWRGRQQVTLKWRESVLSRYAVVTVDTRRNPSDQWDGDQVNGDLEVHLRGFGPEPDITYSEATGFQEWRGYRGPGWVALLAFAAWLGTGLLVIGGPEPWRATRWAWGWFVLMAGPLGSLGYLLLGGPLSLARPKDVRQRLTGGWAFLIALVFFGGANAG